MIFDLYHNLEPKVALKNALRVSSDVHANGGASGTTGIYNGRVIDLHGYQGAMIAVEVGVLTDDIQTFHLEEGHDQKIKLSELAVAATFTTNKWSFWYKTNAAASGPMIGFRFTHPNCVNPDGAGHVDVTLMSLQAGCPLNAWTEKPILSTDVSAIFYGNTLADNTGFSQAVGGHTLAQTVAEIAALNPLEDTGNWELTGIMVTLYEAAARIVYLDDITIKGVTFEFESDITDYTLGGFFNTTPDGAGDAIEWSTVAPYAGKSSVKVTKAGAGSTGIYWYFSTLHDKLTWVDFSDVSLVYLPGITDVDQLGTAPIIPATANERVYWFGYIGHQRYIRVVDTVTANGGQTGGVLGAIAILGVPRHAPTALP